MADDKKVIFSMVGVNKIFPPQKQVLKNIYLSFFKLIPELKFCFGLSDVVRHRRTDLVDPLDIKYTQAVKRAFSRLVVLSFYFE